MKVETTHASRQSPQVLAPFVRDGLVTVVDYSGREQGQNAAYADAARRAAKEGVAFVGAIDLDECYCGAALP